MFKKRKYLLVLVILLIFSTSIMITIAQEVPVHEKLSPGFVKLNNDFAVAIVNLERKDEYKYITATVAIKKLSPSDLKYPLRGEHAIITLNLIDDQGEIFSTDHDLNYIQEYLYCLPKGFVFTEEFSTSAPVLALNHIKTINILGHEVNLVELDLGSLENTDLIIHATERVQLNKWLDFKIDGIIDSALKDFQDLYIKGTIMNSSYDDKDITINLSYQNKNGQLFYTDGTSYKISGKSSKSFALSLGSSVKKEEVRACLVRPNPYEEGSLFILPMHDKIPFFYPPTINYTGGPARKYYKVFYDPPKLKTISRPSHLNDFVWETKVEMHRVGYTSHAYFKFVMSFDRGEGTFKTGIYSNTGNPIEEDMHSGSNKIRPNIIFPDEATSASFYIDFSEKPRY